MEGSNSNMQYEENKMSSWADLADSDEDSEEERHPPPMTKAASYTQPPPTSYPVYEDEGNRGYRGGRHHYGRRGRRGGEYGGGYRGSDHRGGGDYRGYRGGGDHRGGGDQNFRGEDRPDHQHFAGGDRPPPLVNLTTEEAIGTYYIYIEYI